MSGMKEDGKVDDVEFKWGEKKARGGGKNKTPVQFYNSFTYDGEEYSLYDSVYLFKDGEADPYIGKIVKIWEPETKSKSKKVKILWFFRPSEILYYLYGLKPLENELFLGTGVGTSGSGLENINPLEAIAGKCNVICISKDERNRKPSLEELNMADYIFYRTFDVDKFNISDKLGEQISKTDVKFLLNKKNSQISNPMRIESSCKGYSNNFVAGAEEGLVLQKKDTVKEEADPNSEAVPIEREPAARQSLNIGKHSPVSNSDGVAADVGKVDPSKKNAANSCGKMVGSKPAEVQVPKNATSPHKSSSRDHIKLDLDAGSKYRSEKIKEAAGGNSSKPSEAIKKVNHGRDGSLDGRPCKKLKSDDYSRSTLKLVINADKSNLKELSNPADVSNDKKKHERKDFHGPLRVKSPAGNSSDDRPFKKLKSAEPGGSSVQKLPSDSAGGKIKAPLSDALVGDGKLKRVVKDSNAATNASLTNKIINGERVEKFSNDKSHIAPSKHVTKKDAKVCGRVVEVNRRPDADSSKWFTSLPWEDRMKAAQDEGTLVLLQNLDPTYTSSEVEDIIWHGFHENCTAKALQRAAISSPHSGQAFVIFKTKPAAIRVLRELEEGVLMLPNGRPLLGRVGIAHFPGKPSSFPGHLVIDRLKHQIHKDKREAVSTSHASQPNNLEYDMAMEWCLLQERSDLIGKNLRKKQVEEFKKLKGNLRRKL